MDHVLSNGERLTRSTNCIFVQESEYRESDKQNILMLTLFTCVFGSKWYGESVSLNVCCTEHIER